MITSEAPVPMRARVRVANAPASWGALEFEWAGDAPPYARVLDEMAAAGYAGTELGEWGFLPTNADALGDELSRRHLALAGAFVAVSLTDERAHAAGADAAIRVATLMAAVSSEPPVIALSDATAADPGRTRLAGRIRREHALDERRWTIVAAGAESIARQVHDATGLRTAFHHHCATFVETPWEIDELMNRTSPTRLGLCVDTGHCVFGGGDPLATLDRWRERIWHVHLKDCDPQVAGQAAEEGWDYQESVRRGVFCELGRGAVDVRAVLSRLERAGYEGWIVVEQDALPRTGAPAQSAARNREYLKSLGL